MATINPYLNFNGNTLEAFTFYQSVFGGQLDPIMYYKDMPEEYKMGEVGGDKVMHMSLPLGNGFMLMGSDTPDMYPPTVVGNNVQISITAENAEEANKIFNGLAEGEKVNMALDKVFWGGYFGMLEDKYNIQWLLSYE